MSHIVELRVVKVRQLPLLADAYLRAWEASEGLGPDEIDAFEAEEAYHQALEEHSREIPFTWSGYVFFHITLYLERRGIELGKLTFCPPPWERGEHAEPYETAVSITPDSKELLPKLDPAAHDPEQISKLFEEMGYGYETAGTDGVRILALLRDVIGGLADDEALLIREY